MVDKLAIAVEYYDIVQDPIKHYFLDKISFILSRKEILSEILNKKIFKSMKHRHSDSRISFEGEDSDPDKDDFARFNLTSYNRRDANLLSMSA